MLTTQRRRRWCPSPLVLNQRDQAILDAKNAENLRDARPWHPLPAPVAFPAGPATPREESPDSPNPWLLLDANNSAWPSNGINQANQAPRLHRVDGVPGTCAPAAV